MPDSDMQERAVVPMSPDDIERSRISLLLDSQGRPMFQTNDEVKAEFERRRAERDTAATNPPEPEVVEGVVTREEPPLILYPEMRVDLESIRRGNLNEDQRREIRRRLEEAGFEFDSQGGPIDEADVEHMPFEEFRARLETQTVEEVTPGVINVGGDKPEVGPSGVGPEATPPTPEPVVDRDRLKELMEKEGQKLMVLLGTYSGGDLTSSDVAQLRAALTSTGVNVTPLNDDQVRGLAGERTRLAKEFLLATGLGSDEVDLLGGEELMGRAQGDYFRTLVDGEMPGLIERRDATSDASFNRKGTTSADRAVTLENMRKQLGGALDRIVVGMDFYDNNILLHRNFQERFRDWLNAPVVSRLEHYRNLTKDAGIRELYSTPDDWVRAIRERLSELEESDDPGQRDAWLKMRVQLETASHYPQQVEILKSMDAPELSKIKAKLTAEIEARAGLHAAWRTYSTYRTDADRLVSAMTNKVGEKEDAPEEKLKFFSMDWLASIATSEKEQGVELGKRVSVAIQRYVQIGEVGLAIYNLEQAVKEPRSPVMDARKAEMANRLHAISPVEYQRFNLNLELSDIGIADARRTQIVAELKNLPPRGANIFSDKLNEVAARREREKISGDASIGKDAEEIAMRIIYLFGLGAKYSFSQDFDCYSRDDLASLMRPNDAWQKDQIFSKVPVGPYEIIGKEGVFDQQPLRYISLLASYPDKVGEVLMDDGRRVIPMMQALRDGEFDKVLWNEIPSKYQYNSYIRAMGTAKTVEKELLVVPPGGEEKIELEFMKKFRGQVEAATGHIRTIKQVETEEFETSGGRRWTRPKYKQVEGEDDQITNFILYDKYLAITNAHDPGKGVPPDKAWKMAQYAVLRRNLGQIKMPSALMDSMISYVRIGASAVAGAVSLGGK